MIKSRNQKLILNRCVLSCRLKEANEVAARMLLGRAFPGDWTSKAESRSTKFWAGERNIKLQKLNIIFDNQRWRWPADTSQIDIEKLLRSVFINTVCIEYFLLSLYLCSWSCIALNNNYNNNVGMTLTRMVDNSFSCAFIVILTDLALCSAYVSAFFHCTSFIDVFCYICLRFKVVEHFNLLVCSIFWAGWYSCLFCVCTSFAFCA